MAVKCLRDSFSQCFSAREEKKAISFLRNGVLETQISYGELHQESNQMANIFLDMGVTKGDRVLLYLPKSLGFVIAHLALQKIGAITVPLNPGLRQLEIAYLLEDTDAKLVLSGSEQTTTISEIDPQMAVVIIPTERPYQELDLFRSSSSSIAQIDIKPQDAGLIIYTSGTTGKPKGVILTQKNLVHDAQTIIKIWEIAEPDVLCHALPLFHVHGLCFALHTALMMGSHVIMLDTFSSEKVTEALAKKEGQDVCSIFMGVPAMYTELMDYLGEKELDFGHIRLWACGSAPLVAKDFKRIESVFGKEPVEREGMSETGMNFSNPLKGVRKPGSIGLPLPDLQVRIVHPDTLVDVVAGQTGEIWLKGRGVTPGYWRKPEETAKAFEKGWFRTGDLGRVDEDGYYYLTDRIKDIIISGGENISPKEVEAVISQVDAVAECSVVGIPDKKWGEKVVAAVVPKPGLKVVPAEIQTFCKKQLHNWKVPKEIVFLKELPKNRMGKVLKEEVKALLNDRGRPSIHA